MDQDRYSSITANAMHTDGQSLGPGQVFQVAQKFILHNEITLQHAWDKAQVSIYKRKCGLSDMVISNMMASWIRLRSAWARSSPPLLCGAGAGVTVGAGIGAAVPDADTAAFADDDTLILYCFRCDEEDMIQDVTFYSYDIPSSPGRPRRSGRCPGCLCWDSWRSTAVCFPRDSAGNSRSISFSMFLISPSSVRVM